MFPIDDLSWAMLFAIAIPVLVILVGVAYQRIGSARDRRRYPPPGRMVAVNAVPLHVRIEGQGSPTVVFESGVAASSVNWTRVQNAVAQFTTTMSYDRAGYAWSGSCPNDLTATEMAEMLREALTLAGLKPPFVLVGHSFGALLVRIYADLWPNEVAGLVLVDPALLAEWANPSPVKLRMLARGVALSRRGAFLARIGFVRLSLSLLTSGASRSQVHFEANEREGRALRSGANHWRSAENAARIMARSPIALVPAGILPKHGEAP